MNKEIIEKKDIGIVALFYTFAIGLLCYSAINTWDISKYVANIKVVDNGVLNMQLLDSWVLSSLQYQLPLIIVVLLSFISLLGRNLKNLVLSYLFLITVFLISYLWGNWSISIGEKIDKMANGNGDDFLLAPFICHSIYAVRCGNLFYGAKGGILSLVFLLIFMLFIYESTAILLIIKDFFFTRSKSSY